jgi:nicotinamidase-related amidase
MMALPIPDHYQAESVGEIWRVPYEERAGAAQSWAEDHGIKPAQQDKEKRLLVLVDVQNTFCIPGFELFVGGVSGTGAVEDNRRLCEFMYHNIGNITTVCATMDTHQAVQIFHSIFLINDKGEHPLPYTLISAEDIETGKWVFNPTLAESLNLDVTQGTAYLRHYVKKLEQSGKYALTVWPYHAMLGGIGHALVPAVEDAVFFHTIARCSQPDFQIKGDHALTENYSVIRPEVVSGLNGEKLAEENSYLIDKLMQYDAVILAGQAKSHCVAWTIEDLMTAINTRDSKLSRKIFLLEDCTSPVVIPGVIDYSDAADAAFKRFENAGMHRVRSTTPMREWPGM